MPIEVYLRAGIYQAAQIAIFALALGVYLKRRELGFLVVALGLGIHAITALLGALSLFGVRHGIQPGTGRVWSILMYAPLVFALGGWAMLARAKRA